MRNNFSGKLLLWMSVMCLLWIGASVGCSVSPTPEANDPALDVLLGGKGQQELAARIASSGHTWQEYSAWGKELVTKGFVANPPAGPAPSPKLSAYFVCTDCHNVAREDPVLTVQDPDARLAYIQNKSPEMFLTQGTTFWGMVNRVSFYNGYYAQYHDLCAPITTGDENVPNGGPDKNGNCMNGTRKMNATSLQDAIQICSAYCSEGRYMLRWEMDAVMAYLWDLQLHLSDLDLSPQEEADVRSALVTPQRQASKVVAMREFLKTKYLRQAGDTYRDMPAVHENADGTFMVGAYQNGETFAGNANRGKMVYERSCLHCHGTPIIPLQGPGLIGSVPLYYQALAKGLPGQDSPYMPEFTLQRLSRQQSADVQAYLQSLGE